MSYESYLAHHGIKGMRWGVRRFQNYDGSLKSDGKKRYLDNFVSKRRERSEQHKQRLIDAYVSQGMSKERATKEVNTQLKIRRALIIAGAVGVSVAVGSYAANKYRGEVDRILLKGTTISRIENSETSYLFSTFYASSNKYDTALYTGKLGITRRNQAGSAYKMNIGLNKNVKVAGNRTARKTFENLYKQDKEFKSYVDSKFGGTNKPLWRMYDSFNGDIVNSHQSTELDSGRQFAKFKAALQDKGYGGLIDRNDIKYSGYKAHSPVILFNTGKEYTTKTVKKLSNKDIDKALKQRRYADNIQRGSEFCGKYVGGFSLLIGGSMLSAEYSTIHKSKNEQKVKSTTAEKTKKKRGY